MSEPQPHPKMTLKQELVLNLLTKTNKSLNDIAATAKASKSTIYRCADQYLGLGFMQKRKEMIEVNKIAEAAGKGPVLAFDNNDDLVNIVESTKQEALPCRAEALPCPSAMAESCEEPKTEDDGRNDGSALAEAGFRKRRQDESTYSRVSAPMIRQAKPCDDGRITIECRGIKISWTEAAADRRTEQILQVLRELKGLRDER